MFLIVRLIHATLADTSQKFLLPVWQERFQPRIQAPTHRVLEITAHHLELCDQLRFHIPFQ